MDYICRRDKKALEHYDFLWEVMEENLKGLNKKKCLSQVATPLPLQQLCFRAMQEYDVAKVLLAPFRLEKTDSAVNTENADDDTLSAFSFEDPIDTHDLLGLLNGFPSRTSSPVIKIGATGDPPASSKVVSVYHHVGLQQLFRQVGLHLLRSGGILINPLLDEILFDMKNPGKSLFNTFCLRTLPEVEAIAEVIAFLCLPSLNTSTNPKQSNSESVTRNSSLESCVIETDEECDDSLVEVYYHLPTALNDTPAKDICYLDQNNKYMNLRFDIDSITHAQGSNVKVDINFNVKKRKLDERVYRLWKRRCTANEH